MMRGKPPDKSGKSKLIAYFSTKAYVAATKKNPLNETFLLSAIYICLD